VRLLQPDAASNFLEHLFANIEAQANPIRIELLAVVNLAVRFEELLDVLFENADALVLDSEL
jgi:hypothetical protein